MERWKSLAHLPWFGLADMKDRCTPQTAESLFLASLLVLFAALDKRHDSDAMLTATDYAAKRFPCFVREHVLTGFDVRFRDAFRRESLKDCGKVAVRLSGSCPLKCLLC
jgi:hypothetical protein